MNPLRSILLLLAILGIALATNPAQAGFHLWDIKEIYSNSDGSVQFIELFTTSDNQEFTSGTQIKSNTKTFIFPANVPVALPNTSANHHLLIATIGFASLPGAVTPDFTLPFNFFSVSGDHVFYQGAIGNVTFASAPSNGVLSLNYPGGTSATNSPTNFAGTSGSVNQSSPLIPTGDYNNNLTVDAADYTAWRDALGKSASPHGSGADGDGDGTINVGDYDFWKTKFGNVLGGSGSADAAPEPSMMSFFVATLLYSVTIQKRSPRGSRQDH